MTHAGPLRLAGYQGPGSVMTQALAQFGEHLTRADPAWAVHLDADVTARGQSARALFDSIEAGEVQVGYMASGYLSARVPELALLDLPFSVHDRQRALQSLAGPTGHHLAQAIANRTGLRVLAYWDNGFRHLSNWRRPIHEPADCQGLSIRTLDSEGYRAAMRALGFDAISLDVKVLRQAVADHRVDAQENPLTNFLGFELWRHHGHLSLTGHLFGVALLVCHRGWYETLTPAAGDALRQAAMTSTQRQHTLAAQEDEQALSFLAGQAVEVVPASQIDLAAMRACCEPLVARASALCDPAAVASYLQGAG